MGFSGKAAALALVNVEQNIVFAAEMPRSIWSMVRGLLNLLPVIRDGDPKCSALPAG